MHTLTVVCMVILNGNIMPISQDGIRLRWVWKVSGNIWVWMLLAYGWMLVCIYVPEYAVLGKVD